MTVVWRQWVEGFTVPLSGTIVETGCEITTDPAFGQLRAQIASASDTADRAVAYVANPAYLPAGDQGRVRFKWKPLAYPAGDPWNPIANAVFMRAERSSTVQVIELYAEANDRRIGVFSQAITLETVSTSQENASVQTVAGTEYTIEVAWFGSTAANGFRRVWIDNVLVHEITGRDMVTVGDATLTAIYFGWDHYDGADTEGLADEIRWAQISDDPNTPLLDPIGADVGTRRLSNLPKKLMMGRP